VGSIVAVLLLNENGQFTPPCPTRPLALHVITFPDSVPLPEPFTLKALAHVAANTTVALLAPVGVTVYVRLPQPVTGSDVAADADCHVPAKAVIDVVGVVGVVGEVGVELDPEGELLLLKGSHPAVNRHARASADASLDFMFFLIVTYHFFLYGLRRRLFHYPDGIY